MSRRYVDVAYIGYMLQYMVLDGKLSAEKSVPGRSYRPADGMSPDGQLIFDVSKISGHDRPAHQTWSYSPLA